MTNLELNQNQIDTLKELATIGAVNAGMSLSEMLNRKIDITDPKITLEVLRNVPSVLGGEEKIVNVLCMVIKGQISGSLLMILPVTESLRLVEVLTGRKVNQTENLDEMGKSALTELGNITAGSYLSALAQRINMKIMHSVPRFGTDMLGALLDGPLSDLSLKSEYALIVESNFSAAKSLGKGHLILIPDPEALKVILKALGQQREEKK